MRKALFTLMCLVAMMVAGTDLRAQEVTIVLAPGWTWISYPNAEPMAIATALGNFEPMEGDMVKYQFGASVYSRGRWTGSVTYFMPGWGYKYYSKRTEDVELVFAQPASSNVATATPIDITAVSAVVGGMVMLPEGSHVFLRGVCWGTAPSPDIDGSHTTDGTGIGSFTTMLEGLDPNTTYYVRAYAVSDRGLAYGNEMTFTTLGGIPEVTTAAVTEITGDGATCGGTVTDGGGLEITARGVCWSTSHNPTLGDSHTADGTGIGGFVSTITGLSTNTTYYVRAYASKEYATSYGEEMTFTTMNGIPAVSTAEVTGITATTATCGGTVTTDGGLAITARGVCWSTSPSPTIIDQHSTDGTGTGSFSSTLTGLTPNTTYYVRAYATNSYVTVYGNQRSFTTEPLPSYTVTVSSNPAEGGTATGGGTYEQGQSCTVQASANAGYTFANWTENGSQVSSNATYTFTVNADRTLVANFVVSGSGDTHDYVDLGLPSGLLWATCNVGADNPEDYGDYFAWGETQPKDTYNWSTYQYCMGSSSTLTKYCSNSSYGYNGFTDNLTTLLPEDDVATANWGDDWRMPTKEEWQELYVVTTCTWTTQNGVDGRLFIAPNGNTLFLPAAGYRSGNNLSSSGADGDYLSSSLYTDSPSRAWEFNFGLDNFGASSYDHRKLGLPVRAVRSSSQSQCYVDLGLPSGTLWATCNLGADSPTDFGDYFAWGETQPKELYNWSTYQHCNGGSGTLTKYCYDADYGYNGFFDNLTVLLPEDDAATINLGNGWRMPTEEEWYELRNNTEIHPFTNQNGEGWIVFTAANGNCLLLPYSFRSDMMGGRSYYWTNSLLWGCYDWPTPDEAVAFGYSWCMDELDYGCDLFSRERKGSIRPVRSGQN